MTALKKQLNSPLNQSDYFRCFFLFWLSLVSLTFTKSKTVFLTPLQGLLSVLHNPRLIYRSLQAVNGVYCMQNKMLHCGLYTQVVSISTRLIKFIPAWIVIRYKRCLYSPID